MNKKYFHFTIGPVQSFVAQARRTKDFWAGSFLLGYLSAIAMLATKKMGGEIIFPLPDEDFLKVIEATGDAKPRHSNIPNRFKAKVPDSFEAQKVVDSIHAVWQGLSSLIYENDLKSSTGAKTKEIWDRQISHFWEISWAMSDNADESNLLDRRKNWRTHLPPDEPGQKCAIMAGFQELSGEEVAQSKAQREFWKQLKASKSDFDLDIGKQERLCALAFIKRRFVRYFKELKVQTDLFTASGWELSPNVPSVALLAAAPWLTSVANHPKIDDLISAAKELGATQMPLTEIKALKDTKNRDILKLDGMVLFDTLLDNRNIYPDQKKAAHIKQALKPLYKESKPSPFYAILMMDGDQLGMQMSEPEKQEPISKALQTFTNSVEDIVNEQSGFLIYAGGDDVLAILPLETALACATQLRASYQDAFKPYPEITTSISAAVIYAHIKEPLHTVLHNIHTLLDDIAKEKTGRDAIAIEVIKPGGSQLIWSKKWDQALDENKKQLVIDQLANKYRKQTEDNKEYSSGFFYRIREIMQIVENIGTLDDKEALLAVEYRSGTKIKQNEALKIIKPLLKQCIDEKTENIRADAALLVRFIAQKGVE